MKYIIVGLGSFGASLAKKLTSHGHEVIGIDSDMERVELVKDSISQSICLDATDELVVSGLPLKETDVVLVAIGENQGVNVMATALFKNLDVKRLISRAINPLHEKVLKAIGVNEIVHPEEESAERWAKKLCLKNLIDSFEVDGGFSMVELLLPSRYVGKTILEAKIREEYDLLVLTTIKKIKERSILGQHREVKKTQGVANANLKLEANDILVLFGANKNIEYFISQNN